MIPFLGCCSPTTCSVGCGWPAAAVNSPARLGSSSRCWPVNWLKNSYSHFLDRDQLLFSRRNPLFTGASYTDLNAVLPAKIIRRRASR